MASVETLEENSVISLANSWELTHTSSIETSALNNSSVVYVDPDTYYLTSEGIYQGGMNGNGYPQWMTDYVQNALATDISIDNNAIIQSLKNRLLSAENGVNQNIAYIQNTDMTLSALEQTVVANYGSNNAGIIDLQLAMATKQDSSTLIATVQQSLFGGNVDSYIANVSATYASQYLAYASDYELLSATLGDVSAMIATESITRASEDEAIASQVTTLSAGIDGFGASINTLEEVIVTKSASIRSSTEPTLITNPELNAGDLWTNTSTNVVKQWNGSSWVDTTNTVGNQAYTWSANASKLITNPSGQVTGWSFGDGTNTKSYFDIYANNFRIVNSSYNFTPFSISGSNIVFNGTVSFTNVTGAPAIPDSTSDLTNDSGFTTLTAVANQGYVLPAGVAAAVNNNTTTINGSKITTGSIATNQLNVNDVFVNNTLRSSDFSTIGGTGFRLKANAAGTSADPTIYGAYIRAGVLSASYLNTDSLKVLTSYGTSAPFSAYSIASVTVSAAGTTGYSPVLTAYAPNYGSGYMYERVISSTSERSIIAYKNLAYHVAQIAIERSIDGGGWSAIVTGVSGGEGGDTLTYLDTTTFSSYVQYRVKLWVDGGNSIPVTATITSQTKNYT